MNSLKNISDISRNHYHYLFTHQNIVGVGVGYNFINGIETDIIKIGTPKILGNNSSITEK